MDDETGPDRRRSRTRKIILGVVLAGAVLGLFDLHAWGEKEVNVRKTAPEISLASSLNSKEKLSLESAKGKVVLLEFWATWCPPCRASIPHLQKLHDRYAKQGLVIISITNEDENAVREFATENRMTFPIGIDDRDKTMKTYGIRSIPSAFLIDTSGKLVWQGHTMALTEEQVVEALKPLKRL